ncbi:hypothetical protein Pmani_014347 [Petrolisthes manimaculis]|uniref:DDE Tnp4 domain-containing protein n=1 Tax=Petrolisthes manimaculis TaxID=1843537 RepID=A0AAE1PUG2_9EUCA|nr:hypothetical protein Pmani_023389 [Petrolisthes manimaculis]KAK4314363.1 hypothetical protein Pmani_014347 [Petrolisthes manimaculis]
MVWVREVVCLMTHRRRPQCPAELPLHRWRCVGKLNFVCEAAGRAIGLPTDEQLGDSHRTLPYVFIGDDAFPLKRYFMKPEHESFYTPVSSLDNKNVVDGVVTPGAWRDDRQLLPLERLLKHPTNEAKAVRNEFMEYFNEEGAVPWQQSMC